MVERRRRSAAVDAAVTVTGEHALAGQRDLGPVGDLHVPGQPHDRRYRQHDRRAVQGPLAVLDDDGLLGEHEHDRAAQRHDAQWLVRRIQHQSLGHGPPPRRLARPAECLISGWVSAPRFPAGWTNALPRRPPAADRRTDRRSRRSPIRTAGWRTRTIPGPGRLVAAQDALARAALVSLPGRTELAARLRELLRAGRRARRRPRGEPGFRQRRAPDEQHPVVVVGRLTDPADFRTLVLTRSRSTRAAPRRSTPGARLRTAGCWRTSSPAAATRSRRIPVLDVETGADNRPTDRPHPLLARRLAAGRQRLLLRAAPAGRQPVRPPGVPAPVGRRDPASGRAYVFGEGLDPRTYLEVDLSPDGRWLVVTRRSAPRRVTTSGSPT